MWRPDAQKKASKEQEISKKEAQLLVLCYLSNCWSININSLRVPTHSSMHILMCTWYISGTWYIYQG